MLFDNILFPDYDGCGWFPKQQRTFPIAVGPIDNGIARAHDMTESLAIGVDLGATKTAIALVSSKGEVLSASKIATEHENGPASALARIACEVDAIRNDAKGDILGLGIGVAGFVRPKDGILIYAANLGWNSVNIIEEIKSNLKADLPVWIQTDANACALGEYFFGAARGCGDFLYTSIGSGLGGAAICNGQLVTGNNNTAGFIGLYSLDPQGRPDPSGLRGNTETVVSGRGLVTITRELLADDKHPTSLPDSEELSPEMILKAAGEGDELASAAIAAMARHLGEIWTPAVALLNPSRIVLAGGIGLAAFDLIAPTAREVLETRLTPVSYADLQIVVSSLESSAVGAACLVLSNAKKQPSQPD